MKKLIAVLALLISTSAMADDDEVIVNVNVSTGATQFVGFSIGTVDGAQGIVSMHALCQLDFGPDARMCTSEEYFTSPSAAAPLTRAWLHPTIVGVTSSALGNRQMLDFSGLGSVPVGTNPFAGLSCNGWQTAARDNGLALEAVDGGKPVQSLCSNFQSVTCCAPAE